MTEIPLKIFLEESELPRQWHNLKAEMKNKPELFKSPKDLSDVPPEALEGLFCKELVEQEYNLTDKYIDIPDGVREFYKTFRPSPLIRARFLEKELDTPAKIYYKFEGTNTSGSHKLNSAAPQVYYAKQQGLTSLTTETGAGQWGTALAMACAFYGMPLTVYMVKVSSEQKPYRKAVIETYGAKLVASPSETTEIGRKILRENPGTGGSLGCAISEAIEAAMKTEGCRYVLGSVLNHVVLHQSIIGLETYKACEKYDIHPDIVIGCAGGGSNLGGLISPFMADKINGKLNARFIAVEPSSCPSLTRGKWAYDFGDTGKTTPLMRMYTLGSSFIPSPSHSGGLRYHGMSPIVSQLYHDGLMEAQSYDQTKVFDAAILFARSEGTLPAPESSHAIRAAINEAIKCKETGEEKTILFGLTGTGYFDMSAYIAYNNQSMSDYIPTDADLQAGFSSLVF
ncbi:MAG: TrpB-like pyridoxal phosphate-dependent enzyme [Oscillospiraceae bacterium]|jgi:tryptophan synthase beta chain|nr:TrpB-like pyridoxal phosphate-dependent enzyme [Oscillospiraceae bacterium]